MSEVFSAGTQYGDYKGTVSADSSDLSTLLSDVKAKLNIPKEDHIVAYEFNANYRGRTSSIDNIEVTAYISSDPDVDENIDNQQTIQVSKVTGELNVDEFFSLFKRLNICLSNKGKFDNAKYEII
ncbi:hypothetical protein FCH30_15970 [Acinetobacter radioresistens]|uniref:hypothetical protein n=1 Tax=Acinetobacter radioresistens TaxID=40216 RepID=UPI00157ACA48|nr:hypothetical protein [Acinetobacter radioresistens]NTY98689.1 hypothetical protein [Acinetobacter radioresistens]